MNHLNLESINKYMLELCEVDEPPSRETPAKKIAEINTQNKIHKPMLVGKSVIEPVNNTKIEHNEIMKTNEKSQTIVAESHSSILKVDTAEESSESGSEVDDGDEDESGSEYENESEEGSSDDSSSSENKNDDTSGSINTNINKIVVTRGHNGNNNLSDNDFPEDNSIEPIKVSDLKRFGSLDKIPTSIPQSPMSHSNHGSKHLPNLPRYNNKSISNSNIIVNNKKQTITKLLMFQGLCVVLFPFLLAYVPWSELLSNANTEEWKYEIEQSLQHIESTIQHNMRILSPEYAFDIAIIAMIIIILGILLTAKNGNNNVDPDWMETDSFEEKADEAIAMAAKSRGRNTSPSKKVSTIGGILFLFVLGITAYFHSTGQLHDFVLRMASNIPKTPLQQPLQPHPTLTPPTNASTINTSAQIFLNHSTHVNTSSTLELSVPHGSITSQKNDSSYLNISSDSDFQNTTNSYPEIVKDIIVSRNVTLHSGESITFYGFPSQLWFRNSKKSQKEKIMKNNNCVELILSLNSNGIVSIETGNINRPTTVDVLMNTKSSTVVTKLPPKSNSLVRNFISSFIGSNKKILWSKSIYSFFERMFRIFRRLPEPELELKIDNVEGKTTIYYPFQKKSQKQSIWKVLNSVDNCNY